MTTLGSVGVTTVKSFQDEEDIRVFIAKVLRDKGKKGYIEHVVDPPSVVECVEKIPPSKKKKGVSKSLPKTLQEEEEEDEEEEDEEDEDEEAVEEEEEKAGGDGDDATADADDDELTTPDPIGAALLLSKHKHKKTAAAAAAASSSSRVCVATDPSSGEPYAALLSMPANAGGADKFYRIQLLSLGDKYFLFSR
jgi:hypothetical protein